MNVERGTFCAELPESICAKDDDATKLENTRLKEMYEEFLKQKLMTLSCDRFKKPSTLQIDTRLQSLQKSRQIKCSFTSCDRCLIIRELKSCGCDPARLHRVALCAATKYNDVDMVNLLLSDKHCDLDSDFEYGIPRPLFTAIYTGNVKLVEVFLNAGASMTLVTDKWSGDKQLFAADPVSPSRPDRSSISPVQYACLLNQTEILQLMVRYDNERKQERYVCTFMKI